MSTLATRSKYDIITRLRIHHRAKRLVRRDAQDRYTFMQQCVSSILDSSDVADEGDAEAICEIMWEELEDLDEDYWRAVKPVARLGGDPDVDYIQDPATGRFQGSRPHATGFMSPNVGQMTFDQAVDAVRSPAQVALARISDEVDAALGIKGSSHANAIGAWADGAENSIIVEMPGASHPQARLAMAMKGHLADQKSVLLFEPGKETGVGVRFDAAALRENHPKTADAFDRLVARTDHNTTVDGKAVGEEGGAGYILPNGDAVLITDSHAGAAREVGSTLDKFLDAGALRFSAAIDREFGDLAIHGRVAPTREQIDTLAEIAAQGNHQRFFVDAPLEGDAVWVNPGTGHETSDKKITPREVRITIGERFPETRGENFLATFNTGRPVSELDAVHTNLLKQGVTFHSLEPTAGGIVVHVFGSEQSQIETIDKVAKSYDAKVKFQRGRGEFIGTVKEDGTDREQRDDARRVYQEIIDQAELPGRLDRSDIGKIWNDLRHRWSAIHAEVEGERSLKSVDYIQDPETGRFQGSHPHGGIDDEPSDRPPARLEPVKQPRLVGSKGHPDLISTANITAKQGKGALGNSDADFFRADVATMRLLPDLYEHNVGLMRDQTDYTRRPLDADGTTDQVARRAMDMAKANMRWLYDTTPADIRDRVANWYHGAGKLAEEQVEKFAGNKVVPITKATVAGVYARLSPQKLWDMNVEMGNRVLDIYVNQQNTKWSARMEAKAKELTADKKNAELHKALPNLRGKKLSQLETLTEKAAWIRVYDQANHSSVYPVLTPEGDRVGTKPKLAWTSFPNIAGAVEIIEANGDRVKISGALGERHKIRSFYNNILDPDSGNDDVTFDTHMVGAAWLRSIGGDDAAVLHSLQSGGTTGAKNAAGSAKNGIKGLYPVYADAVREMASELKITPNAVQAIVWTAKLGRMLNIKDADAAQVDRIWRAYQAGAMEIDEVHTLIDKVVPFKRPEWSR